MKRQCTKDWNCGKCPDFARCLMIFWWVEGLLASMEQGRLDFEDLSRIFEGRVITNLILSNTHLLTPRQQEVAQLYYRENKKQREIADALKITQQAVTDCLTRARAAVGDKIKVVKQAMGWPDEKELAEYREKAKNIARK